MNKTDDLVGQRIHFNRGFSYPEPGNSLGRPVLLDRGSELVLSAEILTELRDRHGRLPAWLENITESDPDADIEPLASLGPWPEGKSTYVYGELAWAEERQRRLNTANAIHDAAERQKAITQINLELGLAVPQNHNTFTF